jgi:GNAT superfamily N-acetyltransferase
MAPEIRPAEVSDVPVLGAMHAGAFAELYPSVLPAQVFEQLTPTAMNGLWERFITRGERYEQWVAVENGFIVGFAGTGPGREVGYEHAKELYFVVVAPGARRHRVGRALMAAADADYLWVWEGNRDAQKFYRKLKFYPDSVARAGTLFGVPLPEVRMSR